MNIITHYRRDTAYGKPELTNFGFTQNPCKGNGEPHLQTKEEEHISQWNYFIN